MSYVQKLRPRAASERRQKLNTHRNIASIIMLGMALTAGGATAGFFLQLETAHGGESGGLLAVGYGLGVVALSAVCVFFGSHFLPNQTAATRRKLMPGYLAGAVAVAMFAGSCGFLFAASPAARDAHDLRMVKGQFVDVAVTDLAAKPIFEAQATVQTYRTNLVKLLEAELATGATCGVGGREGVCTSLIDASINKADEHLRTLVAARESYDLLYAQATANIADIVAARAAKGLSPAERSANLKPLLTDARDFNEALRAMLPAVTLRAVRDDLERPFLKLGMSEQGARTMRAANEPFAREIKAALRESEEQAKTPLTDIEELQGMQLLLAEFGAVWIYALLLIAFELAPIGVSLMFCAVADDIEAEEDAARFDGVVIGEVLRGVQNGAPETSDNKRNRLPVEAAE